MFTQYRPHKLLLYLGRNLHLHLHHWRVLRTGLDKGLKSHVPIHVTHPLCHELLQSLSDCTYSTLVVATHGGVLATHMLLLAALLLVPLGQPCPLHLLLFKPLHTPPLFHCHEL